MTNARQERIGYHSPSYFTNYRGYGISKKQDFGDGYLIDGHKVTEGYIVGDEKGRWNLMPGATWFQTVAAAKAGIDDLIATNEELGRPATSGTGPVEGCSAFNSDAFWARLRVRKVAETNAMRMARLLAKIKGGPLWAESMMDEYTEELLTILEEIEESTDTRTTVVNVDGTKTRMGPRPARSGLDYLGA